MADGKPESFDPSKQSLTHQIDLCKYARYKCLGLFRFSVPVLWDKKTSKIVNNESAEIVRILNSAFNDLTEPEKAALDLYPKRLQNEIDEINSWVLSGLNSERMRPP